MFVALNDLDMFAANIGNAYLNTPCREKTWKNMGLSLAVSKDASF